MVSFCHIVLEEQSSQWTGSLSELFR